MLVGDGIIQLRRISDTCLVSGAEARRLLGDGLDFPSRVLVVCRSKRWEMPLIVGTARRCIIIVCGKLCDGIWDITRGSAIRLGPVGRSEISLDPFMA